MAKEIEVLYGVTPVAAALAASRRKLVRLWAKKDSKNPRLKPILHTARQLKLAIEYVTGDQLFKKAGSKLHQGLVLECGPLEPWVIEDLVEQPGTVQLLVALDQVEDPQNVGAIIRTAAFLGAQAVLRPKAHSAALSAAASKASAGALENFPVIEVGNLSESLTRLKAQGYWILGAALGVDSVPLSQAMQSEKIVLVLGNEGEGLRQLTAKRCDQLIQIPGSGLVESLNVSASASIFIHHFLPERAL